jgi:hypothetical protein
VIFHSYVSLPEGMSWATSIFSPSSRPFIRWSSSTWIHVVLTPTGSLSYYCPIPKHHPLNCVCETNTNIYIYIIYIYTFKKKWSSHANGQCHAMPKLPVARSVLRCCTTWICRICKERSYHELGTLQNHPIIW